MREPGRWTIGAEAEVRGVGLFTGAPAYARLKPAAAGRGIVFRRADLEGDEGRRAIAAATASVVAEARRTVLAADPEHVRAAVAAGGPAAAGSLAVVQTVEHLLSALRGLGLTDVEVDVRGPELPIGDGSAGLWIGAIEEAGIVACAGGAPAPPPVVVHEPVRVSDGAGAEVEALPLTSAELAAARSGAGPATWYTYRLDYANFPVPALAAAACRRIPAQEASIALPLAPTAVSRSAYVGEVARARTFCLVEEAEAMRRAGLFSHVSPRDLLVIGDDGPIDNAYRQDREPARHKLLDLIGDLALCGRVVLGKITATRSGHALNQAMAERLAEG